MYYAVRGFGNLAEASCLLWERACDEHERKRSQRLAARSAAAARSFGRSSPFGRPQALVWQARCQQLSGQREQALRTWQDAVDAAEQYGMPYEAALAHSFLGQHGGALGRHTHLYKARELFQELEAQYHLTAVEVALATSP
jgi:hypothetical protein